MNCVNRLTHGTDLVLMKMRKWLLCNEITLNAQKTEIFLFHRKDKCCLSLLTEMSIDNNPIRYVKKK